MRAYGFPYGLGALEPGRDALLEPARRHDPALEVAPTLLRQPPRYFFGDSVTTGGDLYELAAG